jgi:N utilization substance protein B
MNIPQSKLREVVLQALYAYEIEKGGEAPLHILLMECVEVSRKNVKIAEEKARAVLAKREEFDARLGAASEEYRLERISLTDRAILRLALYELFFEALPLPIVINEATRLSRKFSTPNAATFVQALLNAIGKETIAVGKETVTIEKETVAAV